MIVSIVGGTGRMGKTTARFFLSRGYETYIVSRDKKKGKKTARELGAKSRTFGRIGDSDIVIVSVPIPETAEVCISSAKLMKTGSLLMDIASVKTLIVKQVTSSIPKGINYLSMHPMFGGDTGWNDQNVILCPSGCSGIWIRKVKGMLTKAGAKVHIMSPEEHDEKTAVTQNARHFLTLSFSRYLSEYHKGESLEPASTPDFRRLMDAVKSLSEQEDMVMEIQRANPFGKRERMRIIHTIEKIKKEVES